MRVRVTTAAVLAAAVLGLAAPAAAQGLEAHLPAPGDWSLVPETSFRASGVGVSTEAAKDIGVQGRVGSRGVLDAWGGAAWDADSQCLYFMGGGHADYGGNEVYRFCADTLQWTRLTEPYPLDGTRPVEMTHDGDGDGTKETCPIPVGQPFSAHTYDALLIADGYLYTAAQEPYCRKGQPRVSRFYRIALDDLERNPPNDGSAWQRLPDPPRPAGTHTAVNPHTGNPILLGDGRTMGLLEYSPEQGEFVVAAKQSVDWMRRGGVCITLPDTILCNTQKSVKMAGFGPDQRIDRLGKRINLPQAPMMHGESCLAWHPGRESVVVFPGGRTVYEIQLAELTKPVREEVSVNRWIGGGAAPGDGQASEGAYVSSKCAYIPEHDVFMMVRDSKTDVAFYRLPPEGTKPLRLTKVDDGVHHLCPPTDLKEGCEYDTLSAAIKAAEPGDRIELAPGEYASCAVVNKPLTISGGHLRGRACGGKAALVVKAGPVRIENLECSGIKVSDGNGACIRWEDGQLDLVNVHFHHSQSGILGTSKDNRLGPLTITGSTFEGLGGDCSIKCGRAHGIYIEGAPSVTIRDSRFLKSKDEGHEIKSGVAELVIEDSVIDSGTGRDSRLIDAYNGGRLIVRRSTLREGPRSANSDLIGFGGEMRRTFDDNTVVLEDNDVFCDGGAVISAIKAKPDLHMQGNRTENCR